MNEDAIKKLRGLLGMANRAGKIASGSSAVEKALTAGKVCGLILAEDARSSTAKKYRALAETAGIPLVVALSRETMGQALGKDGERAAVAILDAGFWGAMTKNIGE